MKTGLNNEIEILELCLVSTKKEEGFRAKPYKDTKGLWTIGYGRCLEVGHFPFDSAECDLLGLASPSAFENVEVNEKLASLWCKQYLEKMLSKLDYQKHPIMSRLSTARAAVLVEMAYQMGVNGVLGFGNMWRALEKGDFELAAACMLDSKWAREDSPNRALRLSEAMLHDKL